MQTFPIVSTTPTGYILNYQRGALAVVIPEATVNLITNPSFEVNTVDWSLNGAIGFARTPEAGLFGSYGATVTYTTGAGTGLRYTFGASVALSGIYTASCYIKAPMGTSLDLEVNDIVVATVKGRGDNQWVRMVGRPIQLSSAGSATVDIGRSTAGPTTGSFILDGVQFEQKPYATTYCDGDQQGFVARELAYVWNGQAHASTSERLSTTAAGGRIVSLQELGLYALSMLGLGMPPFNIIASPMAQGGAYYQNTIAQTRIFSLVGDIFAGSEQALNDQRNLLTRYLSPLRLQRPQPLRLIYQNYAQDGITPISEECDLICHYTGGLEGIRNGLFQERVTPEFQMFIPWASRTGYDSQTLGIQDTIADADYILGRNRDGVWSAIGQGLTGGEMISAVDGDDGYRYVGGSFTAVTGVANTAGIARWHLATSTWSAVGTGTGGTGLVEKIIKLTDGRILAVGEFTGMSGVANTRFMALWTPGTSTWSTLGTVVGGFEINDAKQAPNGDIYIGGNFTTVDGVGPHIARYNGVTWNALGSGPTGVTPTVRALAISQSGIQIYAAGSFSLMGGVADTVRIALWTTNTGSWTALSTGADDRVNALLIGANGILYVGGVFSSLGGVSAQGIGTWNGTAFAELGGGIDSGHSVFDLALDLAGNLHMTGSFISAGNVATPDGYAVWIGSTFISPAAVLPGGIYFSFVDTFSNGDIWYGFDDSGSAEVAAITTIDYAGTAPSYPTFRITGPPSGGASPIYQIVNQTTGVGIYFNLSLLVGEIVVLDLDPRSPTHGLISSTRGNLVASILAGSNLADWSLQPGENDISVFSSDPTMTVTATWRVNYLAIEHAVLR